MVDKKHFVFLTSMKKSQNSEYIITFQIYQYKDIWTMKKQEKTKRPLLYLIVKKLNEIKKNLIISKK